jgi:hypothetical protein
VSLAELGVTIRAVNEVSPEFEQISSDAAAMSSNISAASAGFDEMKAHAEATTVSLRTVAGGIRTTAMMGTELITLAGDFGLVDKETSKYLRTIMLMIMLVSTAARMYNFLTVMTTGHTAAVALEGTTTTATTGSLSLSTVAHNIYATACGIAAAAENALNISHATFLALTGVGIGLIIAAAAAIAIFAANINNATSNVQKFNTAAAQTPSTMSGISRAGQQSLLRSGAEGP